MLIVLGAVLALLSLVDAAQTITGLRAGLVEEHPQAALLMAKLGAIPAVAIWTAVSLMTALVLASPRPGYEAFAFLALIFLIGVDVAAVVGNYRKLRGAL